MRKPLFRTVVTSMMGNLFEFYDFILFAYFAPILGKLFFPSADETTELIKAFGVFAVGFYRSPSWWCCLWPYRRQSGSQTGTCPCHSIDGNSNSNHRLIAHLRRNWHYRLGLIDHYAHVSRIFHGWQLWGVYHLYNRAFRSKTSWLDWQLCHYQLLGWYFTWFCHCNVVFLYFIRA